MKIWYLMVSKKKNGLDRKISPLRSLSSLDKPLDGGPRDGPFYPTLKLMIESLIKSNELAQMCLLSLVTVYNS